MTDNNYDYSMNYEEFANAIVIKAVEDFRDYTAMINEIDEMIKDKAILPSKITKLKKKQYKLKIEIQNIIRFIYSDWFKLLSNLEPSTVVQSMQSNVA